MDEDLREKLKELSKNVQDVGRMIGSTKSTIETLTVMSECLEKDKDSLDTYIRIQKDRYLASQE